MNDQMMYLSDIIGSMGIRKSSNYKLDAYRFLAHCHKDASWLVRHFDNAIWLIRADEVSIKFEKD